MPRIIIVILMLLVVPVFSQAQQFDYENSTYDSLLKSEKSFEVLDTIYYDSPMYTYRIKYNFTSFMDGYEVGFFSPKKLPEELLNFMSEYFKNTSSCKNDSMSKRFFDYLNGDSIYFEIGLNLFLGSYFQRYQLSCNSTQLNSDNENLYRLFEQKCDRYLLFKCMISDLHVGMHHIRIPINMKEQLIIVPGPMGIEENYCNH